MLTKLYKKVFIVNGKRGVTVLIASLVASILLAIGLSIFNTTLKDLFFASTARDSGIAFYAADAAAECAQYWDYPKANMVDTFATSSASVKGTTVGVNIWDPTTGGRTCGNQSIANGWNAVTTPTQAETTFTLIIPLGGTNYTSATVDVLKVTTTSPGNPAASTVKTTITAQGYSNQSVSSTRTVQRGVQFTY